VIEFEQHKHLGLLYHCEQSMLEMANRFSGWLDELSGCDVASSDKAGSRNS
jgi:hypothetical protein